MEKALNQLEQDLDGFYARMKEEFARQRSKILQGKPLNQNSLKRLLLLYTDLRKLVVPSRKVLLDLLRITKDSRR